MSITKAVLACGGWSTRFLPTTKAYAKQLLPILDKPQILYILDECVGAGLTDICIVHRDGETTLKDFLTPNPELNKYLKSTGKEKYLAEFEAILGKITRLEFLPQTDTFPYGNCSPILVAKDFIGSDPFVYIFGDDLNVEFVPGHFLSAMINSFEKNNTLAVVAVQEVPHQEIVKYGCIEYKKDSAIKNQLGRIVEKPALDEAPSDMANDGRLIISPKIFSVLNPQDLGKGNELWLVDAVNKLAKMGVVVTENYLDHKAKWYTTGDPANWLQANLAMAKLKGMKIDFP